MSYFSKINPIYFPTNQSPFDISEHEAANEFAPSFNQVFLNTDVLILQARIPEHASGSAFSVKLNGITYSAPLTPMINLLGFDYHTLSIPLSPFDGVIYVNAQITDNNVSGSPQTFVAWPIEVIDSAADCAKFYRKIEYSGNKLAFQHWFNSLIRPIIRINGRIRFAESDDNRRETLRLPDYDTIIPYGQTASIHDLSFEWAPLWLIEKMTYVMKLPDVEIDGAAVLEQSPLRKQGQRESHDYALFRSDMQVIDRIKPNVLTQY